MPKPRDPYRDTLPMAVLFVLVHGKLPPNDGSKRGGLAKAFILAHDYREPKVIAELRSFWYGHADEVRGATPPGVTPWVVRVLASSNSVDDPVDDTEED